MTNRILQSDIDMAKRLIAARHTDEEIIGILTRRRIERDKADQLVAALRAGDRVEPEVEINYEVGKVSPEFEQPEPVAEAPRYQRSRSGSSRSGGGKKWILWLVVLLGIGAAAAFLLFSGGRIQPDENQEGEATPTNETPATEQVTPAPGELPAAAPPPVDVPLTAPAATQ